MKKYAIAALALVMIAAFLTGCGCMNNAAEPTSQPTIMPTTAATTEATTVPTTAATTEAPTMPTTNNGDTTNSTDATGDTGMTGGNTTEDTNAARGRAGSHVPGRGY